MCRENHRERHSASGPSHAEVQASSRCLRDAGAASALLGHRSRPQQQKWPHAPTLPSLPMMWWLNEPRLWNCWQVDCCVWVPDSLSGSELPPFLWYCQEWITTPPMESCWVSVLGQCLQDPQMMHWQEWRMSFNNYVFLLGFFGDFFHCFLIEAAIRKIKRENVLSLIWACLLGILLPLSHLRASLSTGSHSAPIIPSPDQTFSISVYLVHQNHRHPASPTEQTSYEVYFCFVFTWFYLAEYLTNKQTNVFTEESQNKYHRHVPLIVIIKNLLQFISQKTKKREIWTAFSKVCHQPEQKNTQ